MELVNTNIKTMAYIDSDAHFNRAKTKGFWGQLFSRLRGQRPCLAAFDDLFSNSSTSSMVDLGLQEVSLTTIIGSVGRNHDFTRHFLPCHKNQSGKERWRKIYTLTATGTGFPPVDLYKIGTDYFVEDGHHRLSVVSYLGWETIQARVIEVTLSEPDSEPDPLSLSFNPCLNLCNGVM